MTQLIQAIDQAATRDEVREALTGLKVKDLKAIADHYRIYYPKPTKAELTDRIVESTVGARLRSQAIKDTKLESILTAR